MIKEYLLFGRLKSLLCNLCVFITTLGVSLHALSFPTEINSPQGARKINVAHPACDGQKMGPFFERALTAYNRGELRTVGKRHNDGIAPIQVVSNLVVVKPNGRENRIQKEPELFRLSTVVGMSCFLPSIAYKGQLFEVLGTFLPRNKHIPANVQHFNDSFANSLGVVTLARFNAIVNTCVKNWCFKTELSELRNFFYKNIDRQSLQELALARIVFGLQDLYPRNIVLKWVKGRISFFHFDTGGKVVKSKTSGETILAADSMDMIPGGNGTIELCWNDKLTERTRQIIKGLGKLITDPQARQKVNRLWPTWRGESFGALGVGFCIKHECIGAIGRGTLSGKRDSAFVRFVNRITLLQSFVLRRPNLSVWDLKAALLGVTFFEPTKNLIDLGACGDMLREEDDLTKHGLSELFPQGGTENAESLQEEKEALSKLFKHVTYQLEETTGCLSGRRYVIETLLLLTTNTPQITVIPNVKVCKKVKSWLQRLFPSNLLAQLPEWDRPTYFSYDESASIPAVLPRGFNPFLYMWSNTDVMNEFQDYPDAVLPALLERDYLFHGQQDKLPISTLPRGFSWKHYMYSHRDVQKSVASLNTDEEKSLAVMKHYLIHGHKQGRALSAVPSDFNYMGYMLGSTSIPKGYETLTGNELRTALEIHYLQFGRHKWHTIWTADGYLAANPGLRSLFKRKENKDKTKEEILRHHYLDWGQNGGLRFLPKGWTADGYLATNPGLSNLFARFPKKSHEEVLREHYLKWGQNGGLRFLPEGWTADGYLAANPGLRSLFKRKENKDKTKEEILRQHYLDWGHNGGLRFLPEGWTADGYLAANPGLSNLFARFPKKSHEEVLREHYLDWGQNGGLKFLPEGWTADGYLAANPGLSNLFARFPDKSYEEVLREHYLDWGQKSGLKY